MIEYLQNSLAHTNVAIGYIYFNYKSSGNDSANTVVCRLLKQLLLYATDKLPTTLESLYRSCAERQKRPKLSDIVDILKTVVGGFRICYFIFDALDECPKVPGRAVMKTIWEISQWPQIKIMVTSRPHQPFLHIVEFHDTCTLEIKADDRDVRLYLSVELAKATPRIGEKLQKAIIESLRMTAEGT